MNKRSSKPRVIVSKCLTFSACRWDGVAAGDSFVKSLKGQVDFVAVCPEALIGLGIPRHPIRIVISKGRISLMQPATLRDLTDRMKSFASKFLGRHTDADGFILKERSPSCGLSGVKWYSRIDSRRAMSMGGGLFGSEAVKRFPRLPIETEESLKDPAVRERFLKRIFKRAARRAGRKA